MKQALTNIELSKENQNILVSELNGTLEPSSSIFKWCEEVLARLTRVLARFSAFPSGGPGEECQESLHPMPPLHASTPPKNRGVGDIT